MEGHEPRGKCCHFRNFDPIKKMKVTSTNTAVCLCVCFMFVHNFPKNVHKTFTVEVGCILCCSPVRMTTRRRPLTVAVKHPVRLGELCLALVLQILVYRKSASCEACLVLFWINCMLRPCYHVQQTILHICTASYAVL